MIITVNIDNRQAEKLDQVARADGHTSRSAVIRKAIAIFLRQAKTSETKSTTKTN